MARAPLNVSWAAAAEDGDHLNIGDALSPVMVACVTQAPIKHQHFDAPVSRISAVGSIAHLISGGEVTVWGSGATRYRDPMPGHPRELTRMPADTRYRVAATRGPLTADILSGAQFLRRGVFGDPVWLLPRFYRPRIEKKYDLGVIIHLSDLADSATEAHPHPRHIRYQVPPSLRSSVRLINTVTDVSMSALKHRLDEILACRRIVSTSLHGLVFAESYGIPCLFFSPQKGATGLVEQEIGDVAEVDFRMADLYAGIGLEALPLYRQHRLKPTDWEDVIATVDRAWMPKPFDGDRLIDAFPGPVDPIARAALGDDGLFDHPAIAGLPLRHGTPDGQEKSPASGRWTSFFGQIGRALSPRQAKSAAAETPSLPSPADTATPALKARPARSVVLLGFFGRGNVGDEAFLHVQYELLKDRYNIILPIEQANAHPDFRSWYPYTQCEIVNYDDIPRIYEADVLAVHIGGGSLAFGFSGQFLLSALDAGKKLLVSGIDAGVRPRMPAEHIRFDLYRRLDLLSVRGVRSLDNLRQHGVAVHHGADWALGLTAIAPEKSRRGGALVTIRAFGEPPGESHRRDMFALHRYLERQGYPVRYLPFAPEDRDFLDHLPHVQPDMIENVWWDPRRVKGLMQKADLVVSVGRLHTLILGMTAGKPVFAVDPHIVAPDGKILVNRKNQVFAEELGLDFFGDVDSAIAAYGDSLRDKLSARDFPPDYYLRLASQKQFLLDIIAAEPGTLPAPGEQGHWSGPTPGSRSEAETFAALQAVEEAREEDRRVRREARRQETLARRG